MESSIFCEEFVTEKGAYFYSALTAVVSMLFFVISALIINGRLNMRNDERNG